MTNLSVTTFDELCEWNSLYVTYKINSTGKPILYELINEKAWIKDIIYKYNKLKFLTFSSQPGDVIDYEIFPSLYHKYEYIKNIQQGENYEVKMVKCILKQRAYIRGYMYSNMARKLFNYFLGHEFLYIRTSDYDIPYTGEIKYGSMTFLKGRGIPTNEGISNLLKIEDTPICKGSKSECEYTEEEMKLQSDSRTSLPLDHKLFLPFRTVAKSYWPSISNEFLNGEIVEVEIFDIRWNYNSCLWRTILDFLEFRYTF